MKNSTRIKWIALLAVTVLWMTELSVPAGDRFSLVPQPKSVVASSEGHGLRLEQRMRVGLPSGNSLIREHFQVVRDALRLSSGVDVEISADATHGDAQVVVELDSSLAPEAYRLTVDRHRVRIQASTIKGVAHGTATLLQLIGGHPDGVLPAIDIRDEPGCSYRSFMMDLGRNPHSLECLKETIDLLWFYKLDSLHLHLTDDQRFAFPSKAFPKLATERDKISWEEFEQLERYAQVRGITIIPELEVPGHSSLLCRAYPEVFGKNSTDVATLPTAREGIKTLLDEMIEVFSSSPLIHIGGDEAYGVPEDLQRDLINDLQAHLKSRGKTAVVWEGPRLGTGENKVDEEVIQLNWRTVSFPADQMLEAGYRVVNASWDPLYIVDHYPRNNFTMASPEHIYRTLDLYRYKHFNPGFPTYHKPLQVEPNPRVIGFCMPWWEGREVNFFPLVVPRVIPMAEVAWNPNQDRDYADFAQRSETCEATRRRCCYPIAISASPLFLDREGVFHGRTTVTISSRVDGQVRYTLDGKQPTLDSTLYQAPFELEQSATVRSAVFASGQQIGHGSRRTFVGVTPTENLALGKPVTTSVPSGPLFSAARLTDGGTGNLDYFLGYPAVPDPIAITIDLKQAQIINQVVVHAYSNGRSYESYEVLVSQDGEDFHRVAERLERPDEVTSSVTHNFPSQAARYVRILTRGHKGQVFDSFSRLTEIQVFRVAEGAADGTP